MQCKNGKSTCTLFKQDIFKCFVLYHRHTCFAANTGAVLNNRLYAAHGTPLCRKHNSTTITVHIFSEFSIRFLQITVAFGIYYGP